MSDFGKFEPIVTTLSKRVDTAADDMQAQLDTLETVLRQRAVLVSIEQDGRKLRLTFTRNNKVYQIEAYATVDMPVSHWRDELLGDVK